MMRHLLLGISVFACLSLPLNVSASPHADNLLFVANQMEHSVLLVDPIAKQVVATVGVDINGHEVAVSPDGRLGYVPIYGNTWVGKAGSNGSTIHVVDLHSGRTVAVIDIGDEVRPHCAHFGPDGLLYVSAELANALYIVDTKTRSVVGKIPTGASHTHMFVISPDGRRIYTANNEPGSVSVLDLRARTLLATIPISKRVQRISLSSDGKFVFTQDQETPRIVVIDAAANAIVRSITVPRIVFSSVITNDGRWLLANSESGKLFVIDFATGALTKTFDTPDVPVLPTPGEFALSADGTHAYVSCPQGGTIEVLDLKDWKLEEPIRLTKGVDGMAWVPSTAELQRSQVDRTKADDISTEIKALENDLARAVVGHDYASLKRIEADTYVYTDADAQVNTRDEFIQAYRSGKSVIPMLRFHDMVVDVYGNVAVVRGVLTVDRTDNGVHMSRSSRYTRTYIRFPEGWRAVAGHSSQLKK